MKTKLLLFIPCFLLLGLPARAQDDPVHDGDPDPAPAKEYTSLPALTANKWVTYCPPQKARIPKKGEEGCNAGIYKATYDYTNKILVVSQLNDLSEVFIGRCNDCAEDPGYLLMAETNCDAYSVEINSTFTLSVGITSDLKGNPGPDPISTTGLYTAASEYFLILHATDQCFIQYTGSSFPANKAFLIITKQDPYGPAPSIRIVEESDVVTTINNYEEEKAVTKTIRDGQFLIVRDSITYDLMGRTIR